MIETLLSKAGYSSELVARINHSKIICYIDVFWDHPFVSLQKMLQTLTKGIGDYLMRVTGSVPIGLRITGILCDYERDFV